MISSLARALDESSIPYQVDLCWLDAVEHPALREHIARMGQVMYDKRPPTSDSDGGERGGATCAA